MAHADPQIQTGDTPPTTELMAELWGALASLVMAIVFMAVFGLSGVLASWAIHSHDTTLREALSTALTLLGILGNGGHPL